VVAWLSRLVRFGSAAAVPEPTYLQTDDIQLLLFTGNSGAVRFFSLAADEVGGAGKRGSTHARNGDGNGSLSFSSWLAAARDQGCDAHC